MAWDRCSQSRSAPRPVVAAPPVTFPLRRAPPAPDRSRAAAGECTEMSFRDGQARSALVTARNSMGNLTKELASRRRDGEPPHSRLAPRFYWAASQAGRRRFARAPRLSVARFKDIDRVGRLSPWRTLARCNRPTSATVLPNSRPSRSRPRAHPRPRHRYAGSSCEWLA